MNAASLIQSVETQFGSILAAPIPILLVLALGGFIMWRGFRAYYQETVLKLRRRLEHRDKELAALRGRLLSERQAEQVGEPAPAEPAPPEAVQRTAA